MTLEEITKQLDRLLPELIEHVKPEYHDLHRALFYLRESERIILDHLQELNK